MDMHDETYLDELQNEERALVKLQGGQCAYDGCTAGPLSEGDVVVGLGTYGGAYHRPCFVSALAERNPAFKRAVGILRGVA